jgi:putative spermidine/putrescine transport system substrate-binding protein
VPTTQAARRLTIGVWGGTGEDAIREINEHFVQQYTKGPVSTAIETYGWSSEALEKARASWPKIVMDAWGTTVPAGVWKAMRAELISPLTYDEVPELRNQLAVENVTHDGQIWGVPIELFVEGLQYRKDLVGKKITKFSDLFSDTFKGKKRIYLSLPSWSDGSWLIMAALSRGGDENNIDPGFEATKELAKNGAIGGVFTSQTDASRLFMSGDAWVLGTCGMMSPVREGLSLDLWDILPNREAILEDTKGIGAGSAYVVLKGQNQDLAKDWVNFLATKDMDETWCAPNGTLPTNKDAHAREDAAWAYPTPQDWTKKCHVPGVEYLAQLDAWTDRWNREIIPLIS